MVVMLAFISDPSHRLGSGFPVPCSLKGFFLELGPRACGLHLHHSGALHRSGRVAGPRGWSTLMGFSSWWLSQILGVSGPLGSQGWTGFCFWLGVEIVRPGGMEQEFRQELPLLAWAPENMERKVFQYQAGSKSNEGI